MAETGGKLGTFSTLSIGIGAMVGGGIFAVTGLTIETTRGAAPLAFVIAGIVALLTSYSYLRLTLAFPGEGGTVSFLNRAFGGGIDGRRVGGPFRGLQVLHRAHRGAPAEDGKVAHRRWNSGLERTRVSASRACASLMNLLSTRGRSS